MNFLRKASNIPTPTLGHSLSTASGSSPEAFNSNSAYGRGFFEPGAYSVALKRCENGHDLAQSLCEMYEERAQLETAYVNQLRAWSRKWHGELVKSQEYGTNKKVWDQSVTTGEQMAEVHANLSSSLSDNLVPKLRQWRKDNYEKSMVHYKKTKEFEKEFIDAQKSWSKLLEKIAEARTQYHTACKTAKAAENAERTAVDETARRKLGDKAEVARREVGNTKAKYEQTLNESREQRPRYEQAMTDVFERTQTFERKRLDFFKEAFEDYGKMIDTATNDNTTFKRMIEDYQAALLTHDSTQDLSWWDQNYGTQTNNRWPEFDEFRE